MDTKPVAKKGFNIPSKHIVCELNVDEQTSYKRSKVTKSNEEQKRKCKALNPAADKIMKESNDDETKFNKRCNVTEDDHEYNPPNLALNKEQIIKISIGTQTVSTDFTRIKNINRILTDETLPYWSIISINGFFLDGQEWQK